MSFSNTASVQPCDKYVECNRVVVMQIKLVAGRFSEAAIESRPEVLGLLFKESLVYGVAFPRISATNMDGDNRTTNIPRSVRSHSRMEGEWEERTRQGTCSD